MSNTGFTVILNETITNTKISDGAFRLLTFLTSMAYGDKTEVYPSQEYISKNIGKSVRTVQRKLQELRDAKLIEVKRRGSISNVYTIMQKVTQNIHSKAQELVNKAKDACNKSKKEYKTKKSEGHFNNYEQRSYDFDSLEKKLLGWDVKNDLDGSEYLQGNLIT